MAKQTYGCLGYVLCPDYGDCVNESRSISYAVEQVKLPDLEPFATQKLAADDTLDDIIPEPLKPPTASLPGVPNTTSQVGLSSDLGQHLASIDSNLLRIANALEQLAGVLTKK